MNTFEDDMRVVKVVETDMESAFLQYIITNGHLLQPPAIVSIDG